MVGPVIRWWWGALSSLPAAWAPVAVLAAAWVLFLARVFTVETFYAWCAAGLALAVVAWTARLALLARRVLTRLGRRWR